MSARIHVDENIESFIKLGHCTLDQKTPEVSIHVEYDQSDIDDALRTLAAAYRSIVAQIEETR